MTRTGPWLPGPSTSGEASAQAYPFGVDFSGPLTPQPSEYFRSVGALTTEERWTTWPITKVSGADPGWAGAWPKELRGLRSRDLSHSSYDVVQNFRAILANINHPGATLPPGAVGVEYLGGSSRPVVVSVNVVPHVAASLIDEFLAGQFPTEMWTFAVKVSNGLHATAFPVPPYYYYGARTDIAVDPPSWPTVLTGTVNTSNVVTLSAPSFDLTLDIANGFSIEIVPTSTSGNVAQDGWEWRAAIDSLTMTGVFNWPDYRYIYDDTSAWGLRQRQTPAGGPDGWPLRARQNAGATGSWSLRHRQNGN